MLWKGGKRLSDYVTQSMVFENGYIVRMLPVLDSGETDEKGRTATFGGRIVGGGIGKSSGEV